MHPCKRGMAPVSQSAQPLIQRAQKLGTLIRAGRTLRRLGNAGQPMTRTKQKPNKWVAKVKTISTYPPPGLFTRSASTIARTLASKKVSPKGPGSGMRMLTYFINRAGRGLSPERRVELEKAKILARQTCGARRANPAAASA